MRPEHEIPLQTRSEVPGEICRLAVMRPEHEIPLQTRSEVPKLHRPALKKYEYATKNKLPIHQKSHHRQLQ